MAKQQNCISPITIEGIEITQSLIDALKDVQTDLRSDMHTFAEQCMLLAASDQESYGLDRHFHVSLYKFYQVMKALDTEFANMYKPCLPNKD